MENCREMLVHVRAFLKSRSCNEEVNTLRVLRRLKSTLMLEDNAGVAYPCEEPVGTPTGQWSKQECPQH